MTKEEHESAVEQMMAQLKPGQHLISILATSVFADTAIITSIVDQETLLGVLQSLGAAKMKPTQVHRRKTIN